MDFARLNGGVRSENTCAAALATAASARNWFHPRYAPEIPETG